MKHLRIAMWSGPRNISTAMMRSFSSRSDTYVSDEPFYANYLMRTGIDHPGREEIIESYDTDYDSVISDLQNDIPDNKSIWYQKHMAQHIDPTDNLKWTNSFLNCLLIRNPNEVIPSFLQKSSIADSDALGYSQQLRLLQYHDYKIPTVDAKDILLNPKSMLTKICSFFKIEFEKADFYWIRPQQIQYSMKPEKKSYSAIIIRETFHGLWRKYRLKLSNQIELDMVVDGQCPIKGKEVFITLPPAHLLVFHKTR